MEVDDATPLVFGDFGERDPDLGGKCCVGQPHLAGQTAAQGHRETAPQFRGAGVEQHRAGVVVAVGAQRLPKQRVIPRVSVGARQPDTVRTEFTAPTGTAPKELAVFLPMKVDRAERGRGQCCEHARVLRDRARDTFAAGQSGADHLVGVSAIVLRARRALGGAAGLAGDRQDAAGLVDGGVAVE